MAPSPLKKGKTPEYISLGNDTMSGSGTFSYKVKLKPMPKHTNLPNEITGRNHYEDDRIKMSWWMHVLSAFLVTHLAVFVVCIVASIICGAETVTNFIADLLGSLMN